MRPKVIFAGIALLLLSFGVVLAEDSSEVVLKVQTKLQEEGFNPGPRDGLLGPRTSQALTAYQREFGLKVTGRINEETLEHMGLKDSGFFDTVTDMAKTGVSAVGSGVEKAAEATKKGAVVTAKATKKGAVVTAKATKEGAVVTAKATKDGAEVVADKTKVVAEKTKDGTVATVNTTKKGAKAAARTTGKVAGATKDAVSGIFGGDDDSEEARLVARVEQKLKNHPRLDASKVEVESEGDGIIRLTFEGDSYDQWNLAVAQARSVEGVKQVFVRLPGDARRQ